MFPLETEEATPPGRAESPTAHEVVVLQTTERCNLRCIHCVRSLHTSHRRLVGERLQRILDRSFPAARLAIVPGHEGEPLIDDFERVVKSAREHGVRLDVVTNGTRLTLENYRAWRDVLARVNVSLDSPDPVTYARIRRGSNLAVLESQLESIARERRARPDGCGLSVSAVVMRSNLHTLLDLPAWAERFGFGAVMLQPLRQFSKRTEQEDPLAHGFAARAEMDGGAPRVLDEQQESILLREQLIEIGRRGREHGVNVYFGDFALPPVEVREPPPRVGGPPGRSIDVLVPRARARRRT